MSTHHSWQTCSLPAILALACVCVACGTRDTVPYSETLDMVTQNDIVSSDIPLDVPADTPDMGAEDIFSPEDECLSGTQSCQDDSIIQCIDGEWVPVEPACEFGCFDGHCNACKPGSKECSGINIMVCSATGQAWEFLKECQICEAGACACVPDCEGKDCGPDGCEGSCGACNNSNEVCDQMGQCVLCIVDCPEGKICGPDGCGGFCGECEKIPNQKPQICSTQEGCVFFTCGMLPSSLSKCDGDTLYWCTLDDDPLDYVNEDDCKAVFGPASNCSWDSDKGKHWCT